MAHLPPHSASSTDSPSLSIHLERSPATLTSDTVVFSHTKAPSRQSDIVAGTASPATLARKGMQPQLNKFHVEAPRSHNVRRMTVCVMKQGDKLGFGVRHDRYKRLQVSTVQGDSQLRVGDTLLSVNGTDLTGQEFLVVVDKLKIIRPGELMFEIERLDHSTSRGADVQPHSVQTASTAQVGSHIAASAAITAAGTVTMSQSPDNPWVSASVAPAAASMTAFCSQNEARGQPVSGRTAADMTPHMEVPPPSIQVASGPLVNSKQPTRKRARPAQRAVTMLDENGQPVNVTALLADLKKVRAEKSALEEKNARLRKRVQGMLIENDEVRVRAKNEVTAALDKAKREIAEAQKQLTAARAQLRLQDRGPDVGRTDSIVNELVMCKEQLEKLKKTEADRTALLTTRYRGECRIAVADAQRVLDSVVGMFRTKLRQVGRMIRGGTAKPELEVACDGVRRLTFMKLFSMKHDFSFYTSAGYHSNEPVHHTLEQEQFLDLFGSSLFHEERAGLYYVATAPMVVVFDPSAESIVMKCEWTEQNALRDLARNFRF